MCIMTCQVLNSFIEVVHFEQKANQIQDEFNLVK